MPNALGILRHEISAQAEFLAKLDAVVQGDPVLGRRIFAALTEIYGGDSSKLKPAVVVVNRERAVRAEAVERANAVAAILTEKPWMSTPDLERASKLTKTKLHNVLHGFPDRFERRPDPTNQRREIWRVRATEGSPLF